MDQEDELGSKTDGRSILLCLVLQRGADLDLTLETELQYLYVSHRQTKMYTT